MNVSMLSRRIARVCRGYRGTRGGNHGGAEVICERFTQAIQPLLSFKVRFKEMYYSVLIQAFINHRHCWRASSQCRNIVDGAHSNLITCSKTS